MTVLMKDPLVEFVPVTMRGEIYWLSLDSFDFLARMRAERIQDGSRFNNGPFITDKLADKGETLSVGGEVTAQEMYIVVTGKRIATATARRLAEEIVGDGYTKNTGSVEDFFFQHVTLDGCASSEPNLATILFRYYEPHFDVQRAWDLAFEYMRKMKEANPDAL